MITVLYAIVILYSSVITVLYAQAREDRDRARMNLSHSADRLVAKDRELKKMTNQANDALAELSVHRTAAVNYALRLLEKRLPKHEKLEIESYLDKYGKSIMGVQL
jgi:hypothetical protein